MGKSQESALHAGAVFERIAHQNLGDAQFHAGALANE